MPNMPGTSHATTFLADANYDVDDKELGRASVAVAVVRNPRLRYYAGMRMIDDLDSAVGTFGFNYKINPKYELSLFEQYDFNYKGGENLATSLTLTRKLPRWYVACTFVYDERYDDVGLYVTFWPEGVPEVSIGAGRLSLLGRSERN